MYESPWICCKWSVDFLQRYLTQESKLMSLNCFRVWVIPPKKLILLSPLFFHLQYLLLESRCSNLVDSLILMFKVTKVEQRGQLEGVVDECTSEHVENSWSLHFFRLYHDFKTILLANSLHGTEINFSVAQACRRLRNTVGIFSTSYVALEVKGQN